MADALGFGVRPSQAATCEQSSHPGDAARVEVAEARLAPFASFDVADAADGRFACHLLDNAVDVGEEAIELDVDIRVGDGSGDHLVSVDNDELWSVYHRVLRPRFGALMHEAFGVAADASLLSLMPLLRLRAEAGGRYFVKDPDDDLADDNGDVDITAKMMAWFLDLLSAEALLCGNTDVGAVRAFELGDEEQFALTLSIRLGNGDRWDALEAAVDKRLAERGGGEADARWAR